MSLDPRIETLLVRWFEAEEEGRSLSPEELCREAPELLSTVVRLLRQEGSAASALSRECSGQLIPDQLGDFEVRKLLGAGGMGRVYLANQISLGREVALKVLSPDIAQDPLARARFRREAELAARLEHPHIVPVFAIGESDGLLYLAMKRLSGPNLDSRGQTLPYREVARIGAAVASALEAAHQAGIVHRDVKPSNIMMDGSTPYLLDFGLARRSPDPALTAAGVRPGTLLYMAPEQFDGNPGEVSTPADIYALGATLYELATGRPAIEAETPSAIIHEVLHRRPRSLGLPAAASDLEVLVQAALEKRADDRPRSAGFFASELQRVAELRPIESRPASPLRRLRSLVLRHPTASALVAATSVAALGLGIWSAGQFLSARNLAETTERQLRSAFERGELPRAVVALEALKEQGGNRASVSHWEPRLRAWHAYEDLFDIAFDMREARRSPDFEVALQSHLKTSEDEVDPTRREHGIFLRALGAFGTNQKEAATQLSRQVTLKRAGAALNSLVSGIPLPDLSLVECETPDEHILTWLALRWSGAPIARRAQELDLARQLRPTHRRLRLARAIHEMEANPTEPAIALSILAGLAGEPSPRPLVLRNLLKLHLIDSDFPSALASLRELDLATAHRAPTASEILVRTELTLSLGHYGEAAEALADNIRRGQTDFEVLHRNFQLGPTREKHEELTRLASTDSERDLVELMDILLSTMPVAETYWGSQIYLTDLSLRETDRLFEIARRAEALAMRSPHAKVQSYAWMLKAGALRPIPERSAQQECYEALERACADPPLLPDALLRRSSQLIAEFDGGLTEPSKAKERIEQALLGLESIPKRARSRGWLITPAMEKLAAEDAARLRTLLGSTQAK